MYSVLIVEDDPMVAQIEKQYVERNPEFHVSAVIHNGKDALRYLEQRKVDLILLDLFMPVMDGKEFLSLLRGNGNTSEVIMVTAANTADSVASLCTFGVADYLIKPFDYTRFQQAMQNFISRREILDTSRPLSQESIDRYTSSLTTSQQTSEPAYMEKGVQQATLDLIMSFMKEHPNVVYSLDELSTVIGLSRVTMRRYMNHLVKQGTIEGSIRYSTGGRPSSVFCYRVDL